MGRRAKADEYNAKNRITLDELAAHDDVCSDVLIDNAYYKAKIRKNKPKHIPVRGIKEDEIPQILLHHVIVAKDVLAAEKAIMKLPGLVRYFKGLRNKQKQDNFLAHLRKFIYMYQTDCPFEISTTNRYTITSYEAAVTARRRIKQGENIKYLTGTLVPLTTEESLNLDQTNRNFSIVVTGRKKSDQMFLGPARFANHDCDSNARLVMKGTESMEVIAVKNIEVGEEITVSYGDNYFGPDNVECLCHSCELEERNGWTSATVAARSMAASSTPPVAERPESAKAENNKRKRSDSTTPPKLQHSRLKRLKTLASPSKLQHSWTPSSTSESDVAHGDTDDADESVPPQPSSRSTPSSIQDSKPDSVVPQHDDHQSELAPAVTRIANPLHDQDPSRIVIPPQKAFPPTPSATSGSSHDCELEGSTEATEFTAPKITVTVKVETMDKTTVGTDLPEATATDTVIHDTVAVADRGEETPTPPSPSAFSTPQPTSGNLPSPPTSSSTLTMTKVSTLYELPPNDSDSPSKPSTITAVLAPAIIPSIEPVPKKKKARTSVPIPATPVTQTIRVPGDYILTRKLLAQPHDRWVRCHNERCMSFFVQPNGYQTRRECPRCERHSMLYGFPWPKTDPDPRKLLAREKEKKPGPGRPREKSSPVQPKYSAYRRQGRAGKGSWVEGGGDEEERVMDHRTIHRFVLPEEERELSRKGLLVEAEEARRLGDGLLALACLDKRAERLRNGEGRESTGRESSETLWRSTPEGEDEEGRRRSNRIVENRVYVNVDMKR